MENYANAKQTFHNVKMFFVSSDIMKWHKIEYIQDSQCYGRRIPWLQYMKI